MYSNKTIGLVLTIVGAVLALIGIICLTDAVDVDSGVGYALVAAGVAIAVVGAVFMYFLDSFCAKAGSETVPVTKDMPKNRAESLDLGNGPLAKAIRYGADKIDSKIAEGKMTEEQGKFQMDRLMAYAPKACTPEEEAALIEVSQIIGAIAEA